MKSIHSSQESKESKLSQKNRFDSNLKDSSDVHEKNSRLKKESKESKRDVLFFDDFVFNKEEMIFALFRERDRDTHIVHIVYRPFLTRLEIIDTELYVPGDTYFPPKFVFQIKQHQIAIRPVIKVLSKLCHVKRDEVELVLLEIQTKILQYLDEEEKEKEKEITEDEYDHDLLIEIERNPLFGIKKAMDAQVVGEEVNKVLLPLILAAKTQHCIVKGNSSAGKSNLVKAALNILPKRVLKLGVFTENTLKRVDFSNIEILYIMEEMDYHDTREAQLRFLSEYDGGITFHYNEKGPNDNWYLVEKETPPLTVVSTSTKLYVNPENATRNWILTVDDTPNTTMKVLQEKMMKYRQSNHKPQDKYIVTVRKFMSTIPYTMEVVNPFFHEKIIKMPVDEPRARRDIDKIFRLSEIITLLHYKQRKNYVNERGAQVLIGTLSDLVIAVQLANEVFGAMYEYLEGRLINFAKTMITLSKSGIDLTEENIAKHTNYKQTTARNYLFNLKKKGFAKYIRTENNERVWSIIEVKEKHIDILQVNYEEILCEFLREEKIEFTKDEKKYYTRFDSFDSFDSFFQKGERSNVMKENKDSKSQNDSFDSILTLLTQYMQLPEPEKKQYSIEDVMEKLREIGEWGKRTTLEHFKDAEDPMFIEKAVQKLREAGYILETVFTYKWVS